MLRKANCCRRRSSTTNLLSAESHSLNARAAAFEDLSGGNLNAFIGIVFGQLFDARLHSRVRIIPHADHRVDQVSIDLLRVQWTKRGIFRVGFSIEILKLPQLASIQ